MIRHRNGITTYSVNYVYVFDNTIYHFTNAQNKTYVNTQSNFGDVNFGILNRDISDLNLGIGFPDEIIELPNYSDLENAISVILQSYIAQNIKRDGLAELFGFLNIENNVYGIVFALRP